MAQIKIIKILLLSSVVIIQSISVQAQEIENGLPSYTTDSIIDGDALSNVHGRVTVNMAAGDSNLQTNSAALAINQGGALASALTTSHQSIVSTSATQVNVSTALINDNAFNRSIGAISINQVSGGLNSQANGIVFAVGSGVEAVSESVLSGTTSGNGLIDSELITGVKKASIADTAFTESRGLIQINQSAGSKNKTANNFTFQLND